MNKTCELCYLGQHVSEGGYVLLPFASNHLVEPVSSISQGEMDSNGVSIVLNSLRNPPMGAKVMSFSDAETKKRMLKLKRDHVLINLCLLRTASPASSVTEELEFFPLHGKPGFSFETRAEDRRLVPLPITNEQFLEHLRVAFEVAS